MNFDKQKCDEWKKNRLDTTPQNPFTNRKIKRDGPTFKKIDLLCGSFGKVGGGGQVIDLDKVCSKWLQDKYPGVRLPAPAQPPHPQAPRPQAPQQSPPRAESLYNRNALSAMVTAFLRRTVNDKTVNGNACMSNTSTLLKYFENLRIVGRGTFGTVYVGKVKLDGGASTMDALNQVLPKAANLEVEIAIKEARISAAESRAAKKMRFPVEYLFNKLINDILTSGYCPSFAYSYCILFCDHCEVVKFVQQKGRPVQKKALTTCSVTMVEKADGDLGGLDNQCKQLTALFQILAAVHCIHILYGIHHRDIKIENVLIQKIPYRTNQYWRYIVDGLEYFVPNMGFVAILNDFGVSNSLSPALSNGDYGLRNAEVVATTTELKFVPFTTQYYPSISKTGVVTAIPSRHLRNSRTLTVNRFWYNFDSRPSVQVNLRDFQRFPTYAMYQDIQDVLRMFIGGSQTEQPGRHEEMKGLVPTVKKELLNYNVKLGINSIWPEERVELFLANKLIHKIFRKFQYHTLPAGGTVLETYELPDIN